MNADEKLDLCARAIRHVLAQVRDRAEVRYELGWGTESFSRLTTAYAALTNDEGGSVHVAAQIWIEALETDVAVRPVRLTVLAERLRREHLAPETIRTVLRECSFDTDEINRAIGGAP